MKQLVEDGAQEPQNVISNPMTIAGLLNGMVGGTILVLPIIGIATGYITTVIVCALLGFLSYYTGNLVVVHLGKAKNMTESILNHFHQNYTYMTIYAFIVFCSQVPTLTIYFNLICLQLEGLIGYQPWIGIVVVFFLLIKVFVVIHFDIGEQTMGIGVISIISYLIFVGWAMISAPKGEHEIPAFGDPSLLISTLLMAYFIHDLLAQNIVKNPQKEDYRLIVGITFLLGTIIYTFITLGSFAIINRLSYKSKAETIQDYFEMGGIQVSIIELVYLVHLASVFPQYLRLSKIRFFNVMQVQNQVALQWKQGIYYVVIIFVCFGIYLSQISIDTLISINGSILGNLIVIVIPICLHVKCVYFDKKCGNIEGELIENIQTDSCTCHYTYSSKATKYIELGFIIIVFIFGMYTMVAAIKQQLTSAKS